MFLGSNGNWGLDKFNFHRTLPPRKFHICTYFLGLEYDSNCFFNSWVLLRINHKRFIDLRKLLIFIIYFAGLVIRGGIFQHIIERAW